MVGGTALLLHVAQFVTERALGRLGGEDPCSQEVRELKNLAREAVQASDSLWVWVQDFPESSHRVDAWGRDRQARLRVKPGMPPELRLLSAGPNGMFDTRGDSRLPMGDDVLITSR